METREQWSQIKEIVGAALDCSPDERQAFLDVACSVNESLRREVESLLAAYENSGDLSHHSDFVGTAFDALPETVGPYRLVRELGVGGMGQVWLAEQTLPVRRFVALKLIKGGMYDRSVLQRFLFERQSLASMDHPSIAKVFDAGATETGMPYLAMEYVDGLPITAYCDSRKLDIRSRLKLFLQVCEGVQHAHQKAIIHRDLKPSNILIIEVDGKPAPRLIDFGLAKIMAAPSLLQGDETFATQVGMFLGTPAYMSPEQADPGSRDIDTRTDVYSLGVVLYELLTATLPFTARSMDQPLYEFLRQVREAETPRPSQRVNDNQESSAAQAEARGTEIRSLSESLRGDLDWITLKALEKNRDRRYDSPSALAADLENYLENRPVVARPASTGYRLSKYVRRNRVAVAVVSGALTLLAAFAITQAVQLRRITRERDRADRITDFMTDIFKVPDPSESRGNTITAREILDKSSKQIETDLGKDPEVQSRLMQVMALTYSNLGLYSRAHDISERALESRRNLLGPEDPKTLESRNQLGLILYREGRDRDAEKFIRTTIDIETRRLGPEAPLTLASKDDLAILLAQTGNYIEAEKLERELISIRSRKSGPENILTLRSRGVLENALKNEGRFAEAEKESRQTLDIQKRVLGPTSPPTIASMHNLGNLLQEQGRYDEAAVIYHQTIDISQRVLGSEHPETLDSMLALANDLIHDKSQRPEAERLYRKVLEISTRVEGPDAHNTTRAQEGLANLLSSEEHYPEAEQLLRAVLATRQRILGPDHTDTLLTQYNLASVFTREKRLSDADVLFRQTLSAQIRVLGPEDGDTLASMMTLSAVLLEEGKPEEAEKFARKSFDSQLRIFGPQHEDTLESLHYLCDALVRLHREGEAKQIVLSDIHQIVALKDGDPSWAWFILACVDASSGHKDEAFDDLNSAIQTGFDDADELRVHVDLKSIRKDPRFQPIVARAQTPRASRTNGNGE
jgi:serine/threonine protein kinase